MTSCDCRAALQLARLHAKHQRYAATTNELLTAQLAEITDLRRQLAYANQHTDRKD